MSSLLLRFRRPYRVARAAGRAAAFAIGADIGERETTFERPSVETSS
jgi:hypothetical protein